MPARATLFVDGTSVVASTDETYTERLNVVIGGYLEFRQTSIYGRTLTVSVPGASVSGGAVTFSSGNGTLATEGNVTFAENHVTGNGGAILFGGGGLVTHAGSDTLAFTGNSGSMGGAIYTNAGGLTLSGSAGAVVINSNTAVNSGGAFYASGGGIALTGSYGDLLISSNTASGNLGGGAFYAVGGINLSATVGGALSISGNYAAASGGAFNAYSGGIQLNNVVGGDLNISNNITTGDHGGAFWTYNTGDIVLSNSVGGNLNITGNSANYGGALSANNSAIRLNNLVSGTLNISGNSSGGGVGGAFRAGDVIYLGGSAAAILISSNTSSSSGGAFYGSSGIILSATIAGDLDIINNTANGNSSGGGAFYASGSGIRFNNNINGNLNITDNSIVYKTNSGDIRGDGGAFHGGIVLNDLVTGTLNISNNIAGHYGGAFYGGVTISGNYGAILISSNTAANRGGAFYSGGDIILGATVTNNFDITGNTATARNNGGRGGAFYAKNIELNNHVGGTLNISNNIASNYGGAFYVDDTDTGSIILSGSVTRTVIDNNTASGRGGAFFATNVIISVAESGLLTASGNKASADNQGGFAYAYSGSVVFNIGASGTAIIGDERAAANQTDSIAQGSSGKGIYKQGDGTLVLNSVAYTGTTYVQGGTLLIANSGEVRANVIVSAGVFRYDSDAAFTRNVTVSGGKFSYNSAQNFAGTLTFTSGTLGGTNLRGLGELQFADAQHILAPGNSIGTLAADSVNFTNSGVFELELGGAALNDKLVTDALTLSDGGFTINVINLGFSGFDASQNYSWEFLTYGTLNGTFDSEAFTLNTSGFAGLDASKLSVSDSGNALILSYSAVPEPSTWALLLTALTVLTVFCHRQRRRLVALPVTP